MTVAQLRPFDPSEFKKDLVTHLNSMAQVCTKLHSELVDAWKNTTNTNSRDLLESGAALAAWMTNKFVNVSAVMGVSNKAISPDKIAQAIPTILEDISEIRQAVGAAKGTNAQSLLDELIKHGDDVVQLATQEQKNLDGQRHLVNGIYQPFHDAFVLIDTYTKNLMRLVEMVQDAALKKSVMALVQADRAIYEKMYAFFEKYKNLPLEDLPEKSEFLVNIWYDINRQIKYIKSDETLNLYPDEQAGLIDTLEKSAEKIKVYLSNLKQLDIGE